MRVEVSKCFDCPCLSFEEEGGPICNHPQLDYKASQLNDDMDLPERCPLREEELTVVFQQEDNS